jgi:hypothetical protein
VVWEGDLIGGIWRDLAGGTMKVEITPITRGGYGEGTLLVIVETPRRFSHPDMGLA